MYWKTSWVGENNNNNYVNKILKKEKKISQQYISSKEQILTSVM